MVGSTYPGSVSQEWYHRCFWYSLEYFISRYLVVLLRVWPASENPHLATRSSLLFAGQPGCPGERYHPGNSPVEQRGQVGQKPQRSGAEGLWWVCGMHHPPYDGSEQVGKKTQQMAYGKVFGGGQGGKRVCRAHCLQREESAKHRAASSRRGVKAALRVQEQG